VLVSKKKEERWPPAKGQLAEPLAASARMLGDFLQYQQINPLSNPAPSHPMAMLAYWEKLLSIRRDDAAKVENKMTATKHKQKHVEHSHYYEVIIVKCMYSRSGPLAGVFGVVFGLFLPFFPHNQIWYFILYFLIPIHKEAVSA